MNKTLAALVFGASLFVSSKLDAIEELFPCRVELIDIVEAPRFPRGRVFHSPGQELSLMDSYKFGARYIFYRKWVDGYCSESNRFRTEVRFSNYDGESFLHPVPESIWLF